jgi:hypothetical protein
VYTLTYKKQQMKYMHQSFFNMPIPTLIKIMQNNQLTGFPCMTAKNVKNYLAPSPATPKGRMRRPRTGIRSTGNQKQQREKIKEEPVAASEEETMIRYTGPTEEHVITDDKIANNVFCFAALAGNNTGICYTDATRALPVRSIDGNQYYYVAYDYDTNYIDARPVEDLTDETIIKTFDEIFKEMERKKHKPKLNITDNQAVGPLKTYLER